MTVADTSHLPDERIVQLVMKELGRDPAVPQAGDSPSDAADERRHLQSCGACAHRMREMQDLLWTLELAGTDLSPERVEQVWQEAKRAASAAGLAQRVRDGLSGAVRDLVASIAPETLVPSPAVRGRGSARSGMQVFVTDEYAISVSISDSAQAGRLRVVGSVTPRLSPELPGGGRVTIYGGAEVIGADINQNGEFDAEPVPRGDLHIDVELGETRIQLSPMHAGKPASQAQEE